MNNDTPAYDSADIVITQYLKDWINHQDLPLWVRPQLLKNISQTSVKLTSVILLRVALRWVVSRGSEFISFLVADESVIFVPSRDSYCWNPPHLSPCIVQSKVRDTFLLGVGMVGVIG